MDVTALDGLPVRLGLALVAGLAGSAHCVGMCGALVLTVGRQARVRVLGAQLVYATGRVLAYGLLGAIFGLAGGVVAVQAALGRAQGWFLLAAGGAIVVLAVLRLGPWGEFTPGASWGGRLYARIRPWLPQEPSLGLFLMLGILNSLVPCGLLYTMELGAAATASPVEGAALLLAFGVGTAPALVLLGAVGGRLSATPRFWIDKLGSAALIALGIQIMVHGARHQGWLGTVVEHCHGAF